MTEHRPGLWLACPRGMTLPFSRFAPTFAVLTLTLTLTSLPLACDPAPVCRMTRFPAPAARSARLARWAGSAPTAPAAPIRSMEVAECARSSFAWARAAKGRSLPAAQRPCVRLASVRARRRQPGEPCTIEAKGGSSDCDVDFFCEGAPAEWGYARRSPTSVMRATSGQSGCAGGRATASVGSAFLRPWARSASPAENRPCEAQLVCHTLPGGLTCVEPSPIPLNGPCSVHGPGIDCVKGAACELTGGPEGPNGYPMACLPGKAEGEEDPRATAPRDWSVKSPWARRPSRCQRHRTEGEPCRSFQECGPGLECRKGQCSAECR